MQTNCPFGKKKNYIISHLLAVTRNSVLFLWGINMRLYTCKSPLLPWEKPKNMCLPCTNQAMDIKKNIY